jgi:hypothetical protein
MYKYIWLWIIIYLCNISIMDAKMIRKKALKQYIEDIDSVLIVNTMMNKSLFINYCIMYKIHTCEKDAYVVVDRGVEYSIWVQHTCISVNDKENNKENTEEENDECDSYSLIVKDNINNIPIEIYSI